jgi:hypothetical protein
LFGRVKEVYSLSTERERRLAFASRQGFHENTVTFRLNSAIEIWLGPPIFLCVFMFRTSQICNFFKFDSSFMDTLHQAPGLTSILSLTRTPGVALFANSIAFSRAAPERTVPDSVISFLSPIAITLMSASFNCASLSSFARTAFCNSKSLSLAVFGAVDELGVVLVPGCRSRSSHPAKTIFRPNSSEIKINVFIGDPLIRWLHKGCANFLNELVGSDFCDLLLKQTDAYFNASETKQL